MVIILCYGVAVGTAGAVFVGSAVVVATRGVAVAVARTVVRVLVSVDGAYVPVAATVVAVELATVAVSPAVPVTVFVMVTVPFDVGVNVRVDCVPVSVIVGMSVAGNGCTTIVPEIFSVGTGTTYGVSVSAGVSFAAAVARAGARGFDGKLAAVVGMIIWIVLAPAAIAVAVKLALILSIIVASGVPDCWLIVAVCEPEKMPINVMTEYMLTPMMVIHAKISPTRRAIE